MMAFSSSAIGVTPFSAIVPSIVDELIETSPPIASGSIPAFVRSSVL